MVAKNPLETLSLFLCLKAGFLVLQDEKAQLLVTYLWLHYVCSAIIHVNFSVIDVGIIGGLICGVNYVIITYTIPDLCTDASFVVLVVDERVCQLGPDPMRH